MDSQLQHHAPLVSFKFSGIVLSICGSLIPFSPGWLVPLSIPTAVLPESEATGLGTEQISIITPLAFCIYR